MITCKIFSGILFAVCIMLFILAGTTNTRATYPNEKRVAQEVVLVMEIWAVGPPETYVVHGPCDLEYSDPYPDPGDPDYTIIETEIVSMDLSGPDLDIRLNPAMPSAGYTRSTTPGSDFPAESFFDVHVEVAVDFSGYPDTFVISLAAPELEDLSIKQYPPYFEVYDFPPESPPVPVYRKSDAVQVGLLYSWRQTAVPYYPPEAHLHVPTAYGSEVAIVTEGGMVSMTASLSGRAKATEAVFGYRQCGDTGPFATFDYDLDGTSRRISTIHPMGEGDGFTAFFFPGSQPFDGVCLQFEAALLAPGYGYLRDTVEVFVDPTPPIPVFHDIATDSVAYFQVDSFFDITYRLDDELPAPVPSGIRVFPLALDYSRDLTVVNQLAMRTAHDSTSCGVAAMACCLKYFADNGYDELDNPEGDESKPEQTGEEIGSEIQEAAGTDDTGTGTNELVSGTQSYLESHGQSGWSVEYHDIDDYSELGTMCREFEADSEDVLLLLEDEKANGDVLGHFVTLGSKGSRFYEMHQGSKMIGCTSFKVDFMDPWEGGSTANNEYDVDIDDDGHPRTSGYDLDGEGEDARIAGYVKVSPPEEGAEQQAGRLLRSPLENPGWITVDSGVAHGNGIVDTLHWDTSGFPGGLYLMEVVTTDDQGHTCRDLRFAGIPEYVVGDDPENPHIRTMLMGSYPNPFNPSVTIKYSIAKDTRVTLAVYDIRGSRVRVLLDRRPREAGVHEESWDGRNNDGKRLSSGVYFCRFIAEGQTSSKKLILLR